MSLRTIKKKKKTRKNYKRLIDWRRTWIKDAVQRQWESTKPMSHLRFFRRSAAEGERGPAGGAAGTAVGSGRSRHPGKHDGRCLRPPTRTVLHTHRPPLQSHTSFPLQFILDVCTSEFFLKKQTTKKILISKKKSKKKIKRFQLKIPKLQSAFVKLELHGIVFISIVVRFSSTNWEDTNRYSF